MGNFTGRVCFFTTDIDSQLNHLQKFYDGSSDVQRISVFVRVLRGETGVW